MPKIKMNPVVSSNIKAAGYDKKSQTLKLQFSNGSVYTYNGVPTPMYEGIFTSDSAGKFVKEFIVKGKYKFNKN